ncbi:MAG: hypothetical protein OJF59_001933 [Cytophagales bacterium]|jgi:hypothetical protein|nr:hypothetical protein [Bacteroidota bacterium]MBS1980834.1 hypothetical protein [Bacteroidota bacterium]WHZ08180.1 MAG: hypothetical protein OJF59_001933 [Cytophagales bacterium]
MSWLARLQQRWNAKNSWQVIAILLTFICTGFTVLLVKKPILFFLFGNEIPLWAKVLYYVLILPIYNLFLLGYGFLFGQFTFFFQFEKRFFSRIITYFKKKINA